MENGKISNEGGCHDVRQLYAMSTIIEIKR
jgi:hypothetical protein